MIDVMTSFCRYSDDCAQISPDAARKRDSRTISSRTICCRSIFLSRLWGIAESNAKPVSTLQNTFERHPGRMERRPKRPVGIRQSSVIDHVTSFWLDSSQSHHAPTHFRAKRTSLRGGKMRQNKKLEFSSNGIGTATVLEQDRLRQTGSLRAIAGIRGNRPFRSVARPTQAGFSSAMSMPCAISRHRRSGAKTWRIPPR
jgi:hypothetical protein